MSSVACQLRATPLATLLGYAPCFYVKSHCHVNLLPRELRDHLAGVVLHRDIIM